MSYNNIMNTSIAKPKSTNNLIQVRVPADLKERVAKLFESLGTNTSDVIRMMLVRADETKSIPFSIRSGAYPIREVAATFELENMPLDEQDLQELRDYELARVTLDELRQRTIGKIKQENKS